MERKTFICRCSSLEHQISFWYDDEDKQLYAEPHLVTGSFFTRLIKGIKYIFGYKCKYGNFDSMIFKDEDLKELKDFLSKY